MTELVNNYLEEEEWKEVTKDSYRVSGDEVLAAENLGTCMGIGAYDPKHRTAYLLHSSTNEGNFERLLNEFMDEISGIERPFEVVAGGTMPAGYDPLATRDYTGEARQLTEETFEEEDIDFVKVWNDMPVYNRMVVSPDFGILYDVWDN